MTPAVLACHGRCSGCEAVSTATTALTFHETGSVAPVRHIVVVNWCDELPRSFEAGR